MAEIIAAFPGNERLARALAAAGGALVGVELHAFPDGETSVRVDGDVAGQDVTIVCTMYKPDELFLPLCLLAHTMRDLGARSVMLVAPYLSYMRQDARFHPGDSITSMYVARMLGGVFDGLLTVDPHLHRWGSLDELYENDAVAVSAAPAIAAWVRQNFERPVVVGPDEEAEQWARALADELEVPCVVLEKVRRGDRDVEVSAGGLGVCAGQTVILLDDIISTGRTMLETLTHLKGEGADEIVCVGVHGVFSDDAESLLIGGGAERVVTCDSIPHESNAISLDGLITSEWCAWRGLAPE